MSRLIRSGIVLPNENSDWGALFSKYRVVVCDDEESICDLVMGVIEKRLKCDVTVVNTGEAALALVEEGGVHVVVTDMKMPGLHGVPLVERLFAAAGGDTYHLYDGVSAGFSVCGCGSCGRG